MQLAMKVTGTCKFFDSTKGFGFITTESGEDVFVHQSSIYSQGFRSLMEGEPLEFDVQVNMSILHTLAYIQNLNL